MKSKYIIGIIALVTVIGFLMTACDDSSPDPNAPVIDDFISVSQVNHGARIWSEETSFAVGSRAFFAVKIRDADGDWDFMILTCRHSVAGTVTYRLDVSNIYGYESTTWINTDYVYFDGRNTFEIYAVDRSGNRSNTKTITVTGVN